jgi:hypothetical protein
LEQILSVSGDIIFVESLQISTEKAAFGGVLRNHFEVEVCLFGGLFEIKVFMTSLNVSPDSYFTVFKEIPFEEEIYNVHLQDDSLIVQFGNLAHVYSFNVVLNDLNQIVDFSLDLKSKIEEQNISIFENICLFTKNNELILNSFHLTENNILNLHQEGVFKIDLILENDRIQSEPKPSTESDTSIKPKILFYCFFLESNQLIRLPIFIMYHPLTMCYKSF